MGDFRCTGCNKEFDIPRFNMSVNKKGDLVYKNANGDELLCDDCKSPLNHIDIPGPVGCNFGKFASMPIEQKEKFFKDESKRDFKKNGLDYIREAKKRENRNNNPI